MRKTFSLALFAALLLTACSKDSDNPLLNATDGQFLQVVTPSPLNECDNVFFNPSAVRHPSPNDRESCARVYQKNAAFAGIPNAVTLQHIEDPKVKERFLALKK